jgi:hypothetical protein
MHYSEDVHAHASYVVRVSRDDTGAICGVVVRVATGQRLPFADASGAGPLLRELIELDLGSGGNTVDQQTRKEQST